MHKYQLCLQSVLLLFLCLYSSTWCDGWSLRLLLMIQHKSSWGWQIGKESEKTASEQTRPKNHKTLTCKLRKCAAAIEVMPEGLQSACLDLLRCAQSVGGQAHTEHTVTTSLRMTSGPCSTSGWLFDSFDSCGLHRLERRLLINTQVAGEWLNDVCSSAGYRALLMQISTACLKYRFSTLLAHK